MINSKKSLLAVIFLFIAGSFIYSQTSNQNQLNSTNDQTVQNEQSDSFEGNSSYFSDTNSDSTDQTAGAARKNPSGLWLFIRMIVVLAIVVALIYGFLWFIKNKTNIVKTDDEFLRRAAYINIAPGKSVEVITLVDRAYLIGVTEDNITLLGEINPEQDKEKDREMINALNLRADQKQNTKKPLNFNDVMNLFLGKNNRNSGVFEETEEKVNGLYNGNLSSGDGLNQNENGEA